ncbi:M67 family metallopeptidase [Vulcanococcus sp.]|uniref:M67 family metallopeptidase n=1 Tax=Vulcanococcus sp. TaxID=2856995 RepID=UPI00322519FA
MATPAPERLRLHGHCLIVLERTLTATAPQEGCALLLGTRLQEALVLQRIWPCCNSWQPAAERTHRFQLDPREQLLAQRWARAHQLQVLGAAHSHPTSAAVPSRTDLELCLGPSLMLIHSGLAAQQQPWGAWWLSESHLEPDGTQTSSAAPLELSIEVTLDQRTQHLGE